MNITALLGMMHSKMMHSEIQCKQLLPLTVLCPGSVGTATFMAISRKPISLSSTKKISPSLATVLRNAMSSNDP